MKLLQIILVNFILFRLINGPGVIEFFPNRTYFDCFYHEAGYYINQQVRL